MTLVLTVATANKVIQASDRLITYLDGTEYNSDANKAIIVTCRDAQFVISFTGAALVGTGGQQTNGSVTLSRRVWHTTWTCNLSRKCLEAIQAEIMLSFLFNT